MEILGWIANIFLILGSWYVGKKQRWAFLSIMIGEIIYIIVSCNVGSSPMAFICVVFAFLAMRNWWLWGKDSC